MTLRRSLSCPTSLNTQHSFYQDELHRPRARSSEDLAAIKAKRNFEEETALLLVENERLGYKFKTPILEEKETLPNILLKMSENDPQCHEFLSTFSHFKIATTLGWLGQKLGIFSSENAPTSFFLAAMRKLDEMGIRGLLLYKYFELKFHDGHKPCATNHAHTMEAFYREIIDNSSATKNFVKRIIRGETEKLKLERGSMIQMVVDIKRNEQKLRMYSTDYIS